MSDNRTNGAGQVPNEEDFFGQENDRLTLDRAAGIKTISVGYCNMLPERCVTAGRKILIGRIGGRVFGVERQLRNPDAVAKAKTAADAERIADYGTALVGSFNADVYSDGGEVTAEFADSGFCYLPGGFQEGMLARFAGMDPAVQAKGASFSVFIWAEPYANPRGYRYVLTNAIRVDRSIADMRRRMQQEAVLVQGEAMRLLTTGGG